MPPKEIAAVASSPDPLQAPPAKYCYFCDATALHLHIMETDHWKVTLSQEQSCLGRFFVILKRHAPSLQVLTAEELTDWQSILVVMETACHRVFGAINFNWACMMNLAYKEQPYNPHAHWHCRPRYSECVEVNGMRFEDPEFGDHYNRDRMMTLDVDSKVLLEILRRLRDALPK
jgi:diadenosine tetraphosphate (Ap4A) HIT family hydrolase